MPFATGQRLTADALNQGIPLVISETIITATGSAVAANTEATMASVTGNVVAGLTYKVYFNCRVVFGTATGFVAIRIREDTLTGTIQSFGQWGPGGATSANGFTVFAEGNFTAASTGSKTIVATMQGSGTTVTTKADAQGPGFLRIAVLAS